MSLQEVFPEPSPKKTILSLPFRLSPGLRLPLPLKLLLHPPTKSFSKSLWKPTWRTRTRTRTRPRFPLRSKQSFGSNRWKPGFSNFIIGTFTWTTTVFLSRVRTTLTPAEPAGPTASYLPLRSFIGQLFSIGTNKNIALRGLQWREPYSRTSSERTWEMIGLSLAVSVVNSGEILGIKQSLCWTGLLT